MTEPSTPPQPGIASEVARPAGPTGGDPLNRVERWGVGLISLCTGGILCWAVVLPWNLLTLFTLLAVSTGVAHLATAAACLIPAFGPRLSLQLWRVTSLMAALLLLWVTWVVFRSAIYLSALYGGLGEGLSAAMVAIWGLALLLTLPMLVWGLVRTHGTLPRLSRRHGLGGLGLLVGGLALSLQGTAQARRASAAPPDAERWNALLAEQVSPVVNQLRSQKDDPNPTNDPPRLNPKARTSCDIGTVTDTPPEPTVLLHFVARKSQKAKTRCITAGNLEQLSKKVASVLASQASFGPVAFDRLAQVRRLDVGPAWLAPLSVRPGLDGVCLMGRCIAPWQLIARSAFVTHSPLDFLGDLKFGVSLPELRQWLAPKGNDDATEPLLAITTQSTTLDTTTGQPVELRRMHPERIELTASAIAQAQSDFERHILDAQQDNGQFRYTLDPFTGRQDTRNLNLPRQAGTLLALCELGSDSEAVRNAVREGLSLLRKYRRTRDTTWALALKKKATIVQIGDSALPLVAFLACRSRVGSEFDAAIEGLSDFVLDLQNADGSFTSNYDWKNQKKRRGSEALYGPGQSLLALTLLDKLLANDTTLQLNDRARVSHAVQLGMSHVARQHWDVPIYSFFFVEENWNCLTARAALERQRNDAYERFCLDYLRFKSRLILDEDSRVAPDYVGGFGFGNVIPPHNTGAAGFGEALAAAIAVKEARGEDTADDQRLLRLVMAFLMRQQWTSDTCFACVPEAIGALSEHTHSPVTRIDFAQHAWSAVGHGQQVLGL